MATAYAHRLILIVPAAKVAAVTSWYASNISPTALPATLGPALNATGLVTDPVTYRWCSIAHTDGEAMKVLVKLCQLAGVTPPTLSQWNGWTQAQKISWLHSVQTAIRTGYGVYVGLAANDGVWDDPAVALAAVGLKTIAAAAA